MGRYVYHFASGEADADASMNEVVGTKGANLAEMATLGLAVPAGMTIATEACAHYLRHGTHPAGLRRQVDEGIRHIENATARRWGDAQKPLLLSVRSGGPESMPGMMETVLNLGLNDETTRGLARQSGDKRFSLQCRLRLIEMYARVVLKVAETDLPEVVSEANVLAKSDGKWPAPKWWNEAIDEVQSAVRAEAGRGVPEHLGDQLWQSIEAIFESWNASQTRAYRRLHGIESGPGTAVTIMAMVFGNRDRESLSGVGFTRNPISGKNAPYGEYLAQMQGDQTVEGRQRPQVLRRSDAITDDGGSLQDKMPDVYDELCRIFRRLESHYGDTQEIEFTVESGQLWLLQTRRAIRTGPAAVRMALDFVDDEVIDEEEAVLRVDPRRHVPELLAQRIDPAAAHARPLFRGMAATPGAATGRLVTTIAEALARARRGESVVLIRPTTTVEDIDALEAIEAVVTTRGGVTAHAAEVTREIGLPCVCGARRVQIHPDGSGITVGDSFLSRGEILTVDGSRGRVYAGRLPLVDAFYDDGDMERFLNLADKYRRMDVRIDADTLDGVERGMALGAEGIGMCRTEHMVLADRARTMAMRRFLVAGDEQESEEAIEELLRFHRHDIAQLLRAVDGEPVAIRLFDTPLSTFLPRNREDVAATARALEMETDDVLRRTEALEEDNQLLGLRGARLAVVQPSMYVMQVQAIVEAARMVIDDGIVPVVEILIPRVAHRRELQWIVDMIDATIARHLHGASEHITLEVGALIQLPRAALAAESMALDTDVIVIATRDLTRLTWGMTRENAHRFIPRYVDEGFIATDPFASVDRGGVGELVQSAVHRSRSRGAEVMIGVDAGHGADPSSIRFFESLDVDHLSVRPDDVPAARVAAAQAYIAYERTLRHRAHTGE